MGEIGFECKDPVFKAHAGHADRHEPTDLRVGELRKEVSELQIQKTKWMTFKLSVW